MLNNLLKLRSNKCWSGVFYFNNATPLPGRSCPLIPFGVYSKNDMLKPKKEFIPQGVKFVIDKVINIDKDQRRVKTALGGYDNDWLVIATECRIVPEEIDGMVDGWGKDIFDFYTLKGAIDLRKKRKYFKSGKILLNIAKIPFCWNS